ncbi:LCP family protein [Fructilactobacillus cliffordii]|uniref:LCP family protein n=1 Tax=Fructilactobacillus cliffordii TaxID=2940299 RepID=A0A9Q8ZR17_9LACO|nr:LCP family protein [Fructilactobacillus cliffordii]USS85863.1 LCP family protein [Fructilactobacillus cliffordii]USS88932.1 LCP family protein [Fructilactobacillus cliffordii]
MDESRLDRDQRPQRSHRTRNIILTIILVLLVGGIAFGSYKYFAVKNAVNKAYNSAGLQKERDTNALLKNKKPISILLMGTDTGELGRTYKGRTDTMMVVTINPNTHKTLITSIPRDTAVNIPGYPDQSPAKINAAYAYGSAKTAIQTVQKMLNIPIDYYAMINMRGLVQVVDQVGGVTISPELTFDYEGYHFTKGQPTKMDGKKALAYSRMRYDDPRGDFGREQRQRQLLEGVVTKSGSVTSLLNQGFIDSIAKNTQTDLQFSDLSAIATGYLSARKNIENTYLSGQSGEVIGGQDMEVTPQSQLQKTTDQIRNSLDLPKATTGDIALN